MCLSIWFKSFIQPCCSESYVESSSKYFCCNLGLGTRVSPIPGINGVGMYYRTVLSLTTVKAIFK